MTARSTIEPRIPCLVLDDDCAQPESLDCSQRTSPLLGAGINEKQRIGYIVAATTRLLLG